VRGGYLGIVVVVVVGHVRVGGLIAGEIRSGMGCVCVYVEYFVFVLR
jgi:hypothetical protein